MDLETFKEWAEEKTNEGLVDLLIKTCDIRDEDHVAYLSCQNDEDKKYWKQEMIHMGKRIRIVRNMLVNRLNADVEAEPDNESEFKRGDIVKNQNTGDYHMLLAETDDDMNHGWDTLMATGGSSWISSEIIETCDMHIDLDIATVNGVFRFLQKLEDKKKDEEAERQ